MTRLALISDIHGNAVALDAVVADIAGNAVDEIVCLGDVAAGGPQPREVVAGLREVCRTGVRGNAEEWLCAGLPPGRSEETRRLDAIAAWARTQLTSDDIDHLAALPPSVRITTADGLNLFCFHGSPRSDVDSVLPTTPEEELDELFADAPEAKLFAGGHTHLQLLRPYRQSLLINPGSVGLPLGSLVSLPGAPWLPSWAEYALIDVDCGNVEVAFRHVPIDVAALAAVTDAMPHPTWAADLKRRIERWNARSAA